MPNGIDEKGFRELFQNIFQTKATLDLIENKLDLQHRIQIYEIKYFFQSISHEEFLNYQTISYKGKEGLEYLDKTLRLLSISSISSATKDKVISIVEDVYNCFNLVFPRDRYSLSRENAAGSAQNSFIDKQERAANKILDALGLLVSDKDFENNKATVLRLLRNKDEIDKIARDADYITQRLDDIKENLNASENEFNVGKENLFGKLKKENESYKKELRKIIDVSLDELRKDILLQRNSIKDTLKQLNLLKERLSVIDQNVYREELAIFFLKEHDDIKGKIDPIYLIINFCVAIGLTESVIRLIQSHITSLSYINMIEVFLVIFLGVVKLGDYIIKLRCKSNLSNSNPENLRGLLTPYWCWLLATLAGMGIILYKALELSIAIKKNIDNGIDPLHSVLPYCGIYLVLAWFTWFASKQFSYNKQICDEYEYKYALSKSYMLYKKEAESVITEQESNAVLLALLDSVIKNISHSPVQSVRQDVHTPFSEVFNTLKETIKKDKE